MITALTIIFQVGNYKSKNLVFSFVFLRRTLLEDYTFFLGKKTTLFNKAS